MITPSSPHVGLSVLEMVLVFSLRSLPRYRQVLPVRPSTSTATAKGSDVPPESAATRSCAPRMETQTLLVARRGSASPCRRPFRSRSPRRPCPSSGKRVPHVEPRRVGAQRVERLRDALERPVVALVVFYGRLFLLEQAHALLLELPRVHLGEVDLEVVGGLSFFSCFSTREKNFWS